MFRGGDVLSERYRIVKFIAQGGMGDVYAAEDLELRERVAVKTVRQDVAQDAAAIDRFKREIHLARKVTHANVCRIYDVSHHLLAGRSPVIYLTMELLEGPTLADHLDRHGAMSTESALPILRQIAEALQAAHRAGVIHRDFKSRNVMLVPATDGDEPRAVITDFGLARMSTNADAFKAVTVTDGVIGTPAYMAPEQVEGAEVTQAADLYALGVVMFEMVTGRLPFTGESVISTAVKRLREPPPSPREFAPLLEERWERVILRCLARKPEDRYQSAQAVLEALEDTGDANPSAMTSSMAGSVFVPPSTGEVPPELLAAAGLSGTGGRDSYVGASETHERQDRRREWTLVAVMVLVIAVIGIFGFQRYKEWRQREATLGNVSLLAVEPRTSVAVLGFKTPAQDVEWLSSTFTELLKDGLEAGTDLRVVPGALVARARRDLALEPSAGLPVPALEQVRLLTGADYVVVGAFLQEGAEQVRLNLNLQSTREKTTVGTFTESAQLDNLRPMAVQLAHHVLETIGSSAGELSQAGMPGSLLPRDDRVARVYAQGLAALQQGQAAAARDLLQQVTRAEPDNALAHDALASAWMLLGYTHEAQTAAARAYRLSEGLPEEERLWVEARYHETAGKWQLARELYQKLWESFPDELEYGLQLAAAQLAAGEAGESLHTAQMLQRLPAPVGQDPRIDLAEAEAAARLADYDLQRRAAERAAAKAEAQQARQVRAAALITQAAALRVLEDPQQAYALCREAIDLYQEAGNEAGAARGLTHLGNLLRDQGDLEAALENYTRARAVFERLGDRANGALVLNNLALIRKQQGDLRLAEELYREALALCEETGNETGEAYARSNLAVMQVQRGDLAGARAEFVRALELYSETLNLPAQASALDNLAAIDRKRGDLVAAEEGHRQALEQWRDIDQRLGEASALINLGRVLQARGALREARRNYQAALEISREMSNRSLTASALAGEAELMVLEGDLIGARQTYEQVLDMRRELGEAGEAAAAQLALAELLNEEGRGREALQRAEQAVIEFRQERATDRLSRALSVVAAIQRRERRLSAAWQAIDEADRLCKNSETVEICLRVAVVRAEVKAAMGSADSALSDLEGVLRRTAELGLRLPELEARLVKGRIQVSLDRRRAAEDTLSQMRQLADTDGYGLLERKAAEAML